MREDRSKASRTKDLERPASAPPGAASAPLVSRSLAPRALTRDLYCEVDGLSVDLLPGDVSVAGMFVPTVSPAKLDAEVEVFLRVGELSWTLAGQVVRVVSCEQAAGERKRPGFGLLFTNLGDAARGRLRRALDALPKPEPVVPTVTFAAAERPKSAPVTQPLTGEERATLAKLKRELRELEPKTPWSILGVSQGATAAEAKSAFFAASKRYHPHLYSRFPSQEIKDTVTSLFIAHKRAYSSMLKASSAPPEPARATPAPASRPPERETRSSPAPAAERKPCVADIELLISGALRQVVAGELEKARLELEKALLLDPSCVPARVWLLTLDARKERDAGRAEAALAKYLQVLALDPKHHEARTEAKKLSPEGKDKPGLLGRLFGSGDK